MMLGTAPKTIRKAFAAALVLAAATSGAAAQDQKQQQEAPVLVAGSVDCRFQVRPVETVICSTPVLAAMDLQMTTLYNVLNLLVKPAIGVEMAAAQQAFLKTREACGNDGTCIGQVTAKRIGELDKVLKDIAAQGPFG